jgi:molybdate transport system substrate-binding protein
MKPIRMALAVLAACALLPVAAGRGEEVMVFAAASLSDALREIGGRYERQSADRILYNFDSSGTLARQIAEGAPADLFLCADQARMDALAKQGAVRADTRRPLLGNTLVIVAAADSSLALADARGLLSRAVARIVLGDPQTVPAGTYAREFLERQGLWARVADRVVPTATVRAALAAVEAGNADVGFVFRTDAGVSQKVKILLEVPAADTSPIVYPAAVTREAPHAAAAQRFLDYLSAAAAREVFTRFGFSAPGH